MKAYIYIQDRFLIPPREHQWRPPCDVYRSGDELVVRVEAAGMSFDNLSVTHSGTQLLISGIRHDTAIKEQYIQMEIPFGNFQIAIDGPEDFAVDDQTLSAVYENGFLYVRCRGCLPSHPAHNPSIV